MEYNAHHPDTHLCHFKDHSNLYNQVSEFCVFPFVSFNPPDLKFLRNMTCFNLVERIPTWWDRFQRCWTDSSIMGHISTSWDVFQHSGTNPNEVGHDRIQRNGT